MAYALQVQRIERWVMLGQLTSVIAATSGAKVDAPDLTVQLAKLDDLLTAPLGTTADGKPNDLLELESALGVD